MRARAAITVAVDANTALPAARANNLPFQRLKVRAEKKSQAKLQGAEKLAQLARDAREEARRRHQANLARVVAMIHMGGDIWARRYRRYRGEQRGNWGAAQGQAQNQDQGHGKGQAQVKKEQEDLQPEQPRAASKLHSLPHSPQTTANEP